MVFTGTDSSSAPFVDKYCCERCAPRAVEACCDICHPAHFQFPPAALNDKPSKSTKKHMSKPYGRELPERNLRTALITMRRELFTTTLPEGTFLTPQSLMSTKLVDRIVDLAHDQYLTSVEKLRDQVVWCFLDTHGSCIIDLVRQFCPPPPPPTSSPFTTVPLQSARATMNASTSGAGASTAPKKKRKCGECGVEGHYSKFRILTSVLILTLITQNLLAPN